MNQTEQIKFLYDQFVIPTYARSLVLVRGKGARVWDADGKEYLDFGAGVAVNILGHSHPAVTRALKEQARVMIHCSNLYYSEPQGRLAERLVGYAGAGKCFFCNCGATANETLFKLARKFFHLTRNGDADVSSAQSTPSKAQAGTPTPPSVPQAGKPVLPVPEILTMYGSFHGRTLAAISATGQDKVKKGFEPMVEGFRHVPFNDLEAVRAAVGPNTAAILVEPIQGEIGIRPADKEFLLGLRQLCDERNLLLMYDEVQAANGRTGNFFGYQTIAPEAKPDALSIAKGLGGGFPIGAAWASATRKVKTAEGEINLCDILSAGTHASTFGGTPIACSVALSVIEVLEKKKLMENAQRRGKQLVRGLRELQKKFPIIKEIRGHGLMIGVELDMEIKDFISQCASQGLLIIAAGTRTFRLTPPLILSKSDVEEALEKLARALAR